MVPPFLFIFGGVMMLRTRVFLPLKLTIQIFKPPSNKKRGAFPLSFFWESDDRHDQHRQRDVRSLWKTAPPPFPPRPAEERKLNPRVVLVLFLFFSPASSVRVLGLPFPSCPSSRPAHLADRTRSFSFFHRDSLPPFFLIKRIVLKR